MIEINLKLNVFFFVCIVHMNDNFDPALNVIER